MLGAPLEIPVENRRSGLLDFGCRADVSVLENGDEQPGRSWLRSHGVDVLVKMHRKAANKRAGALYIGKAWQANPRGNPERPPPQWYPLSISRVVKFAVLLPALLTTMASFEMVPSTQS